MLWRCCTNPVQLTVRPHPLNSGRVYPLERGTSGGGHSVEDGNIDPGFRLLAFRFTGPECGPEDLFAAALLPNRIIRR